MYIPKKYFMITKKFHIDHDAWKHYIHNYKLKNQDMGFMLNTYHDADSYKDYNPLYYMVGRPQTNEYPRPIGPARPRGRPAAAPVEEPAAAQRRTPRATRATISKKKS
jgi:hypothetical protein